MTGAYSDRIANVKNRLLLLQEELGLLERLAEIENGNGVVATATKTKPAKAKTAAPAAAPADGQKRGRGRPKKNPDAAPVAAKPTTADGQKKPKLPALLQTIVVEAKRPLHLGEIVQLVRDAGYESDAKDFDNMVYQGVQKLAKTGVLQKNGEGKTAEYTMKAA